MASIFNHSNRSSAPAVWRICLASAFRTALACTIVGCTTLYGPASLRRQVAFPAFSYVTVILIVTDATFGDTLRGCWLGLYATVQSLGPAILSLWLIGPARLSNTTTALAVALGAFVVVVPESTHLVAKRIALGQIVIVYVIAFSNGIHTEAVMHPMHVAASTGIGILACVLALLVPIPRLASQEVKHNCKLLSENGSERLKHLVKAFCAEDSTSALASISQAKSLAASGNKLLQSVKRYQESMKWERLPFLKPQFTNPGNRMQELHVPLRGMEMALISIPQFPVTELDGELKDVLQRLEKNSSLGTISLPFDPLLSTVPESIAEDHMKFLQITLKAIPKTHQDLPSCFFFFCTKVLHSKLLSVKSSTTTTTTTIKDSLIQQNGKSNNIDHSYKQNRFPLKAIWGAFAMKVSRQRLMSALKCSLSLGFSVLLGLIYSKENGFWAGLPVAISLAAAREATFRVANVKAQGTVLGTVYGVLGCFVFERFFPIRFLSLLPWFVFTSFLQRSRMYGQAGGISAVIGAILILGRKNYGPPSEFAIARIIETFIGLSCSIMVDLLLQPTRSSTLTKIQLSKCLDTLRECMDSVSLQASKTCLDEKQKRFQAHVNELNKFIGEAEVEPNFWFLPFHSACYGKLSKSLSKMVDLLLFSAHAVEFLQQESHKLLEGSWKEIVSKMDSELETFKELVVSSLKCFQEVSSINSVTVLKNELEKRNIDHDIEMGKSGKAKGTSRLADRNKDEIDKIVNAFLEHSQHVVDKMHVNNVDDDGLNHEKVMMMIKSQIVLSISAIGYCMSRLVRETKEIEEGIKELVQWENPSIHVNLYEITSMIHALQK
ncbi:hypothetical protein FNV43_RR04308 [Rhamnella rubrinervis]|uniref:Integral membrane bound transporter domain-containing protein n=1 Tax=Rhamnella rubrinervis TaxID=2594499 RepID=A0A8K0HJI3_9ROSA|nr:hypothetical protein FNV43_RR04308 [Rhamnella rubrinervis]